MSALGPTSRPWPKAGALAIIALALLLIAPVAHAKPDPSKLAVSAIEINAIALDQFGRDQTDEIRYGKLIWRGGLSLTSSSEHFGGLSGLVLDAAGERFLAISDAGVWLSGRIAYRGTRPANLVDVTIGPIRGLNGAPLGRGRDRDCEAITATGGSLGRGALLTSYERNARIGRHQLERGGLGKTIELLRLPKDAKRLRANGGLEAIAVVQAGPLKGQLVAFAEKRRDGDGHQIGWLLGGKTSRPLRLANADGFQVTDVAPLPDGGLVVLWRDFGWSTGVRMRLERVRPAALTDDGVIQGELLLAADGAANIDNMEAVAVSTDPAGDLVLTLLSDDNFSFLQRTLLLQFTLPKDDDTAAE